MAGTRNTSVKSYDLYREGTTTANFADNQLLFIDDGDGTPFLSKGIIFANDGADDMEISFDVNAILTGRVDGVVKPGEVITFDFRRKRQAFLRGVGGATPDFRFWAW